MLSDIAFCIKTHERPDYCRRAVGSIREKYPAANIYVADDSRKTRRYREADETFELPRDVGLSAGRNHLVGHTTEPYLLFLDDDHVVGEDTDVEKMHVVLEAFPEIGLAGGLFLNDGENPHSFHGQLEVRGDELVHYRNGEGPEHLSNGVGPIERVDITHNFFLARRALFEDVRWDEDLKLAEHTDFFLRLKETGWEVAYLPDVAIEHYPGGGTKYRRDRRRAFEWKDRTLEKHGLEKWTRFGRTICEV